MKRREFITLLGTSVAVWPLAARAQQASGMRRVGVLMGYAENDPEAKVFFAGFTQRLAELGWVEGFSIAEPSLPDKWLELLTEIAPSLQRAAMMFNPDTASYVSSYYLPSFESAAQSRKIAPITARVRSDAEIETVITSVGREPGGGLLVMPDNFMEIHRAQIISLATRNNVPAIYQLPVNVKDGGLLSYGADFADVFRRDAPYVDRVLRGTAPSELPVQMPTKYILAINAKTAATLGLAVPSTLLVRADEVIE